MDRVLLITGCSSGLGEHAARAFRTRPGWRVIATARKEADVERLRAEGFDAEIMDMADEASIDAGFDAAMRLSGGRIDAVFNNAGFGLPGAVEDLPTGALREIFETNVIGLHHLTRRAIPVMRAQGAGRIVQHSSGFGRHVMRWRGAYNASKHALEGLTDTLRIELRGTGIRVITLNTGPIPSKFRVNSIPHFEKWVNWESSAVRAKYETELLPFLYQPGPRAPFQREPQAVTNRLIHALESGNPHPRYHITPATHIAEALRRILPQRAIDAITARL
ncbi:SDR family NAD(P)-dependent oxidoreductase [Rhodobacterales bacterium HKCCE2091]|nr:SDR family NAD(P)-dependent oxidoreductase [Rhodobacterales bacterium HKCCE2091]